VTCWCILLRRTIMENVLNSAHRLTMYLSFDEKAIVQYCWFCLTFAHRKCNNCYWSWQPKNKVVMWNSPSVDTDSDCRLVISDVIWMKLPLPALLELFRSALIMSLNKNSDMFLFLSGLLANGETTSLNLLFSKCVLLF